MLKMATHFPANIAICHRCRYRASGCAGRCECQKSGRDIAEHAAAGDCPIGRHRPAHRGIPLPGDILELLAQRLGIDRLVRLWEKRTGRNCGCAQRKARLNALARRLLRIG